MDDMGPVDDFLSANVSGAEEMLHLPADFGAMFQDDAIPALPDLRLDVSSKPGKKRAADSAARSAKPFKSPFSSQSSSSAARREYFSRWLPSVRVVSAFWS